MFALAMRRQWKANRLPHWLLMAIDGHIRALLGVSSSAASWSEQQCVVGSGTRRRISPK